METKRLQISKTGAVETEFMNGEVLERYDRLALEALDECRKTIMMALRFLNSALWHMPFERTPLVHALSTNGRVLLYDPEIVLDRYRADSNELVRDCLHTILHCTFHHPFDTRHEEFDAWSLACDIAVETCVMGLAGDRFATAHDAERAEAAEQLARIARNLTAPALYQVLRSGDAGEALYQSHGLTGSDLLRLFELFRRDAHDLWASHPRPDEGEQEGNSQPEGIPDLQGEGDVAPEPDDAFGQSDNLDSDSASERPLPPEMQETLEDWQRISKRVDAEMRAQHSRAGAGSMLRSLAIANRKPANYDDFLRRFATVAEDMRINDEEFDYIFYTYGLDRYGNIPLVEPLEYRESERVREFVIALDTSGSCSGELIKTFVTRTYDILRQQTSFGDEINVHLVQCDNRIRTATKVESLRQLESYSDSFWVSGGGGTDFRPVFEYVDALVESGEFSDLRGLIYFTDGYGTFPTRAPDYDAAFVFVDAEETNVKVPAWAMKVLMTQEEVMQR